MHRASTRHEVKVAIAAFNTAPVKHHTMDKFEYFVKVTMEDSTQEGDGDQVTEEVLNIAECSQHRLA